MRRFSILFLVLPAFLLLIGSAEPAPPKLVYTKKDTRDETLRATMQASGLPSLQGKWYIIGPFDNSDMAGFDAVYPPEKEIDLKKTYKGKGGVDVAWKDYPKFQTGAMNNLAIFGKNDHACAYLYHEIEVKEAVEQPISLGSDDTLTVWLNGQRLLAVEEYRPAAPDQNQTVLKLKPGKNQLLIKVCNGGGGFELYLRPRFGADQEALLERFLNRDFPQAAKKAPPTKTTPEGVHYRLETIAVPQEAVLEAGGLKFRPDGKLLACTRRGDVWLISNPGDPAKIDWKLFATGLHEPLGLHVESNKEVYVLQRPELTKLVDSNGDDVADQYITICDKWGCSGDYHEFAFGPAKDKEGNFYITLNVGFGGGNPARSPYRGWCLKITPKGEMIPVASGLRSPNGVNFSPDGDLFYSDNQGEWVVTGKLHHIQQGEWYGHPVALRWVPGSPFAGKIPTKYPSGMMYDGQKGPTGVEGELPFVRPCILFPYGKMGQSQTEPIWDTTGGTFGPFAGQCLVGDMTTSNIMRVDLEKVKGRYQGACFMFREGFQCGVNRMVFAPDGSLYVGETNRGWGSRGGKPWGLERLVYTGVLPFEMHTMRLTPTGWDVTFTKPLDQGTADKLASYSMQSHTYLYNGNYGCPEMDKRAEKIEAVKVSSDRKKVSITVPGLKRGRVYELRCDGVRSEDGEPLLHKEGYYTLNELKE